MKREKLKQWIFAILGTPPLFIVGKLYYDFMYWLIGGI